MLTVHHLGKSQSERIVWLCEELGIPYELKRYERLPVTMLAPPEYKALHPLGAAPVITDVDVVLAESAAIIEYIAARHGNGRPAPGPRPKHDPGSFELARGQSASSCHEGPARPRARSCRVTTRQGRL